MNSSRLLVVTGPTASGKSALAVRIAEQINGEIINADSVQVYRGLRIGAGAPSDAELSRVPHHLFGTIEPRAEWNAGIFRDRASALIQEIGARGKVPIVTGGTGLYIRALLMGLVDVSVTDDAKAKVAELMRQLEAAGVPDLERTAKLHQALAQLDPDSAARISASDPQRIVRALEVNLSGSHSYQRLQQEHGQQPPEYDALVFCLLPERERLYAAIDQRVDAMIGEGLIEEVTALLRDFPEVPRALQTIGYKEATRFLRGELSEEEFRTAVKRATRQFAKRQMTWWRHQPEKLGWELPAESWSGGLSEDGGGPVTLPEMIAEARRYLTENTSNPVPRVRFYTLSGVGFPDELG